MERFTLMARHDLVATVEVTSDQLGVVDRLARELPRLRIVLDHSVGRPT
jgi:predicted TIM-barrel fold metal-dependent hydrolase